MSICGGLSMRVLHLRGETNRKRWSVWALCNPFRAWAELKEREYSLHSWFEQGHPPSVLWHWAHKTWKSILGLGFTLLLPSRLSPSLFNAFSITQAFWQSVNCRTHWPAFTCLERLPAPPAHVNKIGEIPQSFVYSTWVLHLFPFSPSRPCLMCVVFLTH